MNGPASGMSSSIIGERLAELIASPERWNELKLVNEVRQVRK
jgi:hypothetical protein